jgi:hypothetical protein
MALFALGLWLRGQPAFVAWQLAVDHQRCFGRRQLPARVWSPDPAEIRDWLEARGTPTPLLPGEAGAAELVGARYCPLAAARWRSWARAKPTSRRRRAPSR